MIGFCLRLLGYGAVAAAFVAIVLDGARSIADSSLLLTRLGDVVALLPGEPLLRLGPAIARNLHPWLWDPLLLGLLRVPAAAAGLLVGFALLRLGRPSPPLVGTVTRF